MFSLLKRQKLECYKLWDVLDVTNRGTSSQSVLAGAAPDQRAHMANCDECHKRFEELAATSDLLKDLQPQSDISRPWFASRVMAAITAREAELSRAVNAWTVVPKLALRLAWATAFAILMVVSLLYQKPATSPTSSQPASESIFDNAPTSATHDDVLVSVVERE